MSFPTLLTIAGFDPSSGAGVTADLAVFAAHGFFGCSAITALTVQSTLGVRQVSSVEPSLLRDTLDCLEQDLPPAGIKIGMLATTQAVAEVATYLECLRGRRACRVVLDPVLISSSGAALLEPEGLVLMRSRLLPLVECITPNRAELGAFTRRAVGNAAQVEEAARTLLAHHPGLNMIVTGGDELQPDDFVLTSTGCARWLPGTRIESRATHGTGCAFSSALLCRLIGGDDLLPAAEHAKRYVEQAIRAAPGLGAGKGPMALLWNLHTH